MNEDFITTNWNGYTRYECMHAPNGHKCNFDVLEDEAAMNEHLLTHAHDEHGVYVSAPAVEVVGEEYEPYLVGKWSGYDQYKCKYCAVDMLDDGSHNIKVDMEYHFDKMHARQLAWEQYVEEQRMTDEARVAAARAEMETEHVDENPVEEVHNVSLIHEDPESGVITEETANA